jgi:sec-independent protein translocase protein TatC
MADADALRESGVPGVPATPESASPPGTATPPVPPAAAGPPPAATPGDESVMSLVDHLSELRTRLVRCILAVAIGSLVGFYFSVPIRNMLIAPLPVDQVQVLGIGDAFVIQLKIAVVVGIILAMPVLLYQVWAFVAPGLTPDERRTVRPWIPLALVFFALGVGLAYLVLPFALSFLLSFTDDVLVQGIAAGPYFEFVTTMFLAFGLVMEFPILMVGLSRVGVLTSERLRDSRRLVILGIAIFAAVATPGGDLISPLALGGTMYLLFEATVFFIKRSGR